MIIVIIAMFMLLFLGLFILKRPGDIEKLIRISNELGGVQTNITPRTRQWIKITGYLAIGVVFLLLFISLISIIL